MLDVSEDGLNKGREALRRFLAGDDDLATMFDKIASIAAETVPACDAASITMLRRGEPETVASTDKAATSVDEAQYEHGDGPCLSALRHRGTEHFRVSSDERWAPVAARARHEGFGSVFSVMLGDEDSALGALNLYSRTAPEFDPDSQATAARFADQLGLAAANAMVYAESYDLSLGLQRAMESRATIEQAKGILMSAERCGPEKAFEILVRASQRENRKLRAVAADIVRTYTVEP